MANSYRTNGLLPLVLGSLGAVGTVSAANQNDGAGAQDAAPAASSPETGEEVTEVVVTGYRVSLRNAIETKKNADVMMDAINAEDIADFPDANLAEWKAQTDHAHSRATDMTRHQHDRIERQGCADTRCLIEVNVEIIRKRQMRIARRDGDAIDIRHVL